MRAVAHRCFGGRLATAEEDLPGFGGFIFDRRHTGVLVGTVAERLFGALATGTPPVALAGLDIDDATMATLLSVDNAAWSAEIPQIEAHLDTFGSELPSELRDELRELEKRLG